MTYYRCIGCGEPCTPWVASSLCNRCMDREADDIRRRWAEEGN